MFAMIIFYLICITIILIYTTIFYEIINLEEKQMNIPKDPVMLLSFINTQLRDFYPSLDELCKSFDLDKEELINKLSVISYEYDESLNKFI